MDISAIANETRKQNLKNEVSLDDMRAMACFFRIIKNYRKMKRLEGGIGV